MLIAALRFAIDFSQPLKKYLVENLPENLEPGGKILEPAPETDEEPHDSLFTAHQQLLRQGAACPPFQGFGMRDPAAGRLRIRGIQKRVPSGTIPALDHDGVILSESEVINEYLNEVFPEPNLLPGSAEQRAKIRMLCRLHDLKLEPIVRSLFPAMSPEKRDAEMVEKRLEEMEQSRTIARLIQPGPFLVGHAPSLADCAFSQTLMLAGMMWKELGAEWSLGKELEDWQQMMGELAPVQSVLILPVKRPRPGSKGKGDQSRIMTPSGVSFSSCRTREETTMISTKYSKTRKV